MKEANRIAELIEDIYDGEPWLDVTLMGTLQNISAGKAAKKVAPHWNSIWEMVVHIIAWRQTQLKRVQGNFIPSPADNYFVPVQDQSDTAWQTTLQQLKDSQHQWMDFLQKMNDNDLTKTYAGNHSTYYKNIHGLIQHDAYHLGQIVLLAKSPA